MKQTERKALNEGLLARYSRMDAAHGLSEVTTLEEALNLDIETGEHFRVNLSALDRIIFEEAESITDGKAVFGHLPSSLTPHHRYGMRLNKKYSAGEKGFLAAYALYMVTGLEKESREWFESLCEEQGFKGAFDCLRKLYLELRACDAEDTDVMGKIETGIGTGSQYHAIDIIEELELPIPDKTREIYESYKKGIRRAGKHQLGAIGKELYAEKGLENYKMTLLWNQYKARKVELESYRGRA
jgi:hypothetical protein